MARLVDRFGRAGGEVTNGEFCESGDGTIVFTVVEGLRGFGGGGLARLVSMLCVGGAKGVA